MIRQPDLKLSAEASAALARMIERNDAQRQAANLSVEAVVALNLAVAQAKLARRRRALRAR